jgi:hypothetical protein
VCYQLRATEYARYYRDLPPEIAHDRLDDALLPDGRPQSFTLLACDALGAVGTARVTLVRRPPWPELGSDCRQVMDFSLDGVKEALGSGGGGRPDLVIGEIGRYAVVRRADVRTVLGAIAARVREECRTRGIGVLLAVMSGLVERRVREVCGIRMKEVPGARLKRSTPEEIRYLVRCRDYFLPSLGRSGMEKVIEQFLSLGDAESLRRALREFPDGAKLYWIESEKFMVPDGQESVR